MRLKARQVAVAIAKSLGARTHRMLVSHMARTGLMLAAMPLVVDTIDAVPEAQRALYVPKDGKFRLDVDVEDTTPLKKEIKELRDEAAKRRIEKNELEKRFDGIDPDQVRALMSRLDTDDEARLIAAGKIDEVITKRTEKQRQGFEKQVKDAETERDTIREQIKQRDEKLARFSHRALGHAISRVAIKVGAHAEAQEDALLAARAEGWTVDDEGEPVQHDKDGQVVMGKDMRTPFALEDWFEEKRSTRKHWFPAQNSGGGAGGDGGARGNRQDLSGLSPTARITAARAAQHTNRR